MRFTSLDPLRDRVVLCIPLLLSGSAVSTVGDSRESKKCIDYNQLILLVCKKKLTIYGWG